jgi:predicted alpha/beta-hydrolase family hydrolase
MRAWAERLASLGAVETFDYPYMAAGRRAPDRLPDLVAAHRAALAAARARTPGASRIYLAGKSMGGRVSCHVSIVEPVAGVICFGYPLRAAGSGKLRDEVLAAMTTPVLFCQGTKDPHCPLDLLEAVRARMRGRSALHVVEGGDHSLLLGRGRAAVAAQEGADAATLAAIAAFVAVGGS